MSRLPLPYKRKCESGLDSMSYVNYVEESFPISAKDVATKTQVDDVLKNIYRYIINGWPSTVTSEDEKS